jgi:hypothetical protein
MSSFSLGCERNNSLAAPAAEGAMIFTARKLAGSLYLGGDRRTSLRSYHVLRRHSRSTMKTAPCVRLGEQNCLGRQAGTLLAGRLLTGPSTTKAMQIKPRLQVATAATPTTTRSMRQRLFWRLRYWAQGLPSKHSGGPARGTKPRRGHERRRRTCRALKNPVPFGAERT